MEATPVFNYSTDKIESIIDIVRTIEMKMTMVIEIMTIIMIIIIILIILVIVKTLIMIPIRTVTIKLSIIYTAILLVCPRRTLTESDQRI